MRIVLSPADRAENRPNGYSAEALKRIIEPGSEITIFLADRQSEFLLLGMTSYISNLGLKCQ